ncbi:hypothetical protein J3459_010823 [Metarhizium acridum]|nr:hypothetical protein J3459_010823 [Metarhizium acridum]
MEMDSFLSIQNVLLYTSAYELCSSCRAHLESCFLLLSVIARSNASFGIRTLLESPPPRDRRLEEFLDPINGRLGPICHVGCSDATKLLCTGPNLAKKMTQTLTWQQVLVFLPNCLGSPWLY